DHRQLRAEAVHGLGERAAVAVGEDDVGEEEIDLHVGTLCQCDRFRFPRRLQDVVALLFERLAQDGPDELFVLHDENRFAAPRRKRGRVIDDLLDRGDRFAHAGKEDLERRSLADFAVEPDLSAGLLDDAAHDGQAEARAASARGEKRVVDLVADFGSDAGAGIADDQLDVIAFAQVRTLPHVGFVDAHVPRLDGQRAALWHRLPRVDGEVQQYLVQLPRIGVDVPQLFVDMRADADVLAEARGEELHGRADDLVEIDDLRLQDLAARGGEELLREVAALRGGALDVGDVAPLRLDRPVDPQQE